MSNQLKPYSVLSTTFLGVDDYGNYKYEIVLNQSLVHTGRVSGIEKGLNDYRENEIMEDENDILAKAESIKAKRGLPQ